jgi:hypothetical protein
VDSVRDLAGICTVRKEAKKRGFLVSEWSGFVNYGVD